MFSRKVAMTPSIGLDEFRHELVVGDVVLFDALSIEEYRSAHIPGALSMPPGLVGELAPWFVPELDSEIVVYGSNAECDRPYRVAAALRTLGYTNVRIYRGGKHEWMRFVLPVESLEAA